MRQPVFNFGFHRVVVRFAAIVAVDHDVQKSWIRFDQLCLGNRLHTDRAGDRNLSVVGIGRGLQQRWALRKLVHRELIQV